MSNCGRSLSVRPRKGNGPFMGPEDDTGARLEAFAIAALSTRLNGGSMPHAKHGVRGA